MLTQKHNQLVCLVLVFVTAVAGLCAAPLAASSPHEHSDPQSCLYAAETSPILILSGPQSRTPQSLFIHVLNVLPGKRPAGVDPQGRALHFCACSGDLGDTADPCTLFALNCMLTV
jgi:hypothetical protein